MPGTQTPNHHASHRRLLWPVADSTPQARVDAIIVPTARPVPHLRQAASAARALACPLVTLHSKGRTRASAAAFYLDRSVDLIAIDVPESAHLRLPVLDTSGLLAGTILERRTDVSTKRNLGLLLSHMLRWKRVIFLDDDIKVPDPADLSKAVSLLDTHNAVGLGIGGFPDNSVVCHAFRKAGGWQDTFIGGGALAVDVKRNRTFFPNVYNEDWFFVLDAGKGLQSVATVGEVLQEPYDPYRPERARAEEFGDVLAEGTFWLLDQGRSASDGDLSHWRDFLAKRKRFIEQVLAMVEDESSIESAERARMAAALRAAADRLAWIRPELCVDYLKALALDQDRWQRHIQRIRHQPKMTRELALEALARRGGTPLTWYTRKPASAQRPSAVRRRAPVATSPISWRPIQPGDLQAPSALLPRGLFPAKAASPALPRREVVPSHSSHALVSADVVLAGEESQA